MGFTKLFSDIVMSTIWREDNATRIVWITMLASSDAIGKVNASVPGLADAARVSIKDCETALEKLSSPDSYSRTKDNEGRRIEKVDGGWLILNYLKYRERRGSRAEYFRQYRKDKKRNSSATTLQQKCNKKCSAQPQAEAEAEKRKSKRKKVAPFEPPSLSDVSAYAKEIGFQLDTQKFIDFYTSKGWMIGKNKMKDWRAAIRTWRERENVPAKEEKSVACCCGCGEIAIRLVSNQWFATEECRKKILGW